MFDNIAPDWARKRKNPWIPFVDLVNKWIKIWKSGYDQEKGMCYYLFIDLGSGSGRHSHYIQQFCFRLIDLDQSREMLKVNKSASSKIQANMDHLPFRSNIFDGIFSIAAIHHVKGKENRNKVIQEINFIGKDNAVICITVWRFFQKKFLKEFFHQIRNCSQTKKRMEIGDITIPWTISKKGNNIVIDRFYHLFRANEFSEFISNFNSIFRCTMGNKDERNNFFFIGNIKKVR